MHFVKMATAVVASSGFSVAAATVIEV